MAWLRRIFPNGYHEPMVEDVTYNFIQQTNACKILNVMGKLEFTAQVPVTV
jgi:hypothetical protein